MSHPQSVIDRFLQLRAEGHSYDALAKLLKVSKRTLLGWAHQNLTAIAQLRALHLDALQEEFQLLRRHRLELLARRLQTVRAYLDGRHFYDVSPDRLLSLEMRLLAQARQEMAGLETPETLVAEDPPVFPEPDQPEPEPILAQPDAGTETKPPEPQPTLIEENQESYGKSKATYEVNEEGAVSPTETTPLEPEPANEDPTQDPDPNEYEAEDEVGNEEIHDPQAQEDDSGTKTAPPEPDFTEADPDGEEPASPVSEDDPGTKTAPPEPNRQVRTPAGMDPTDLRVPIGTLLHTLQKRLRDRNPALNAPILDKLCARFK